MKVFLYDAESDYELQDEELNLEQVITEFYELSDQEGSFFGIKSPKESIQFVWENDDKWLVDVPVEIEKMLCLQKYANYEECVEIIKSTFSGTSPKDIEGLILLNIMTEDLNEIPKRNPHFPGSYLANRTDNTYDSWDWHIKESSPENIPKKNAMNHIGMFMGWILDENLASDSLKQQFGKSIQKFKRKEITDADFLELHREGHLVADDLAEQAVQFAEYYYLSGRYLDDYVSALNLSGQSIFQESHSWQEFETVKKMIQENFEEWSFRR